MCYDNYLKEYALSYNMTLLDVYNTLDFDYKSYCSELCPLECESTYYKFSKNEMRSDDELLYMNFYFTNNRYTEISQTIKTTEADLISNTGGVLGLFLELSFISAYNLVNLIFDYFF